MKPIYRVKANGHDNTALSRNRLICLEVTDESGFQSDRVSIELDDRDNLFDLPEKGAKLDISMGLERDDKPEMVHMGIFVVDEVGCSGPPDKLTIEGKAANMTDSLKEKKTRPWDNITLSDIVATIAGEHDLIPVTGTDLGSIHFDHIDQADESDLHFLTRLGKEHDAVAKAVSKRLLLIKKGQAKTATGKSLPTISITRQDFVEPGWEMSAQDRGKYKSVTAYFQDIKTGEKQSISVGSGKPVSVIRAPFATRERAMQAAQSRMDKLERGTSTLRGSVSARTDLLAEGQINVTGIRSGINGLWSLTKVTFKIDDSGFTVSFESEVPKK